MEERILRKTKKCGVHVAMVVLRGGTHIEKDEEVRSARAGTYLSKYHRKTRDRKLFKMQRPRNHRTLHPSVLG